MPAEEFKDKFHKEDQVEDDDDVMGMPIKREKREEKREKELLEGFAEMYKDHDE